MLLSLTYRRPPLRPVPKANICEGGDRPASPASSFADSFTSTIIGVPEELSFDRVVDGYCCSPCTVRDFMGYLKHVEYNAEPAQFYLWFRNYAARFEALTAEERALSPAWSAAEVDADLNALIKDQTHMTKTKVALVTEMAVSGDEKTAPLAALFDIDKPASLFLSSKNDCTEKAQVAFTEIGLEPPLAADQPFRNEISSIIAIYFSTDGPRQLNLESRERRSVLRALRTTTHPSAFRAALASVEYSLRYQSHPNFIRWALCNGNPPRAMFGKSLGLITTVLALIASILVTLSKAPRAWRVVPLIGWVLGLTMLVAGIKGMCVVLFASHSQQQRPWTLADDDMIDEKGEAGPLDSTENLVGALNNAWEHEPWAKRYQRRALISKIFDRETWIQEPALRKIQNTVALQSTLWALLIGGAITGIFCAVPSPGLF